MGPKLPLHRDALKAERARQRASSDASLWPSDTLALFRAILVTGSGERLSVLALSRRSGCSRATITQGLLGQRKITFLTGMRLCKALEISPWRLYEYFRRLKTLPRIPLPAWAQRERAAKAVRSSVTTKFLPSQP